MPDEIQDEVYHTTNDGNKTFTPVDSMAGRVGNFTGGPLSIHHRRGVVGDSLTNVPKSQSEMQRGAENVSKMLEVVHRLVNALEEKLQPALHPIEASPERDSRSERMMGTLLGQLMESHGQKLDAIAQELTSIIERLEI